MMRVVTTGGGNEREYGMKLKAFCMRSGSRRQGGLLIVGGSLSSIVESRDCILCDIFGQT
jgi:hypothetical protein